jgi:hypothetical protein
MIQLVTGVRVDIDVVQASTCGAGLSEWSFGPEDGGPYSLGRQKPECRWQCSR